MNSIQLNKKNPVVLFTVACLLVVLSFLVPSFPVAIFLAAAPLYAVLDYPWTTKTILLFLLISLIGAIVVGLLGSNRTTSSIFVYLFFLMTALSGFAGLQLLSGNRLNKFSFIILFIGGEYFLLLLMVQQNPVFLADVFQYKIEWTRWNIYTGYLGATLWIMVANLLFYQSILKTPKLSIIPLIAGVLIVLIPMIYSYNLPDNGMTKDEVILLHSGHELEHGKDNTNHSEIISRSSAWVSVLIIIFTLVNIKRKKGPVNRSLNNGK